MSKQLSILDDKNDLSFNKELLEDIIEQAKALFNQIADINLLQDKLNIINKLRLLLHQQSPFKNEPIDCVLWIVGEKVKANDYNPNRVAPPEMKLLQHSIEIDGYTQPIVTYKSDEDGYEVVDGFHRTKVGTEYEPVKNRIAGYLPITIINEDSTDRKNRMSATIRHNRARGKHSVAPLSQIIVECIRNGWSDEQICKEFGMDLDEVLRLKQTTGLPDIFKNVEFSKAWE